jgi:hypothetical protein
VHLADKEEASQFLLLEVGLGHLHGSSYHNGWGGEQSFAWVCLWFHSRTVAEAAERNTKAPYATTPTQFPLMSLFRYLV